LKGRGFSRAVQAPLRAGALAPEVAALIARTEIAIYSENLSYGTLGLVTLNYDFVDNDKVTNSGLEHWQVCKIDGQWKILSVTWTSY